MRAVVTPADPPQTDVCVRGWTCRAVVAATDRDDQINWDGTSAPATVGLLDCRPLLMGWLPVSTKTHWLDLRPITLALSRSAPAGWQVVFPALPSHWTWVCLEPGQPLTVAFAEITEGAEVEIGSAMPLPPAEQGDTDSDLDDGRWHSSSPNTTAAPPWGLPPAGTEPPHARGTGSEPADHHTLKPGVVFWVLLVFSCFAGTLVHTTDAAIGKIVLCTYVLAAHVPPTSALLCLADAAALSEAAPWPDIISAEAPKPLVMRRALPTPARAGIPRAISNLDWDAGAVLDSTPAACLLTPPCCQSHPPEPKSGQDFEEAQPQAPWKPAAYAPDSADLRHSALITLLEESVASPFSEAFMLASTLLDTLTEVLAEKAALPAPVTVHLSHVISPPAFSLDQEQVRLPHTRDLLRDIYCPWPGTWVLPPDWTDASWPLSTRQRLKDTKPWTSLFASTTATDMSFSLYTDGSAMSQPQCSGYAVVLLAHVQSETGLVGILGGQILGDASFPWTIEGPPALHAEHTAIAVAILWALQLRGQVQEVHCRILFDCTAAGWAAEGTWRATGTTGEFVHHLDMIAKATPGITLAYEHVRGHSEDPWNDLADHVAKTAASRAFPWPGPPRPLCKALQESNIAWLAPEIDARVHHAVPILDGVLTWTPQLVPSPALTPTQLVPVTVQTDAQSKTGPLLCATLAVTVNAQSLRAKCKYIEEQLEAKQVNVAFLQETKIPGGTVVSQHYLRLHAPSESHWGVAIWIHKRLGVVQLGAQPVLIEESDLTILHAAPRLIIAVATIGNLRIGLVSGHCPHASRQTERDAFLTQLQPLLQKLKHATLVLGGIDLNGRIPTPFSGVAGDLEFGEPDEAGWRLAALLADNGMWVPSTYPSIHCGESVTYIHPNGQPHRIDYIIVGGKAGITHARSEVDETFDNGSPQEDHKLLQVCLKGHMDPAKAPARLARVQYDRDKLLTREGRECVAQALSSYVHPGWEVSPDQHCHALEQFLHKELATHFAAPAKPCRATYIPESVWQLRETKLSFKRRVRHRASLWSALLCRAFHSWRTRQEYGVLALLGKQRLLYELASAAIRFVSASIKKRIAAAKNTFLQGVAGEGHQGAAKILQRVKQAGMGGRSSRPISRPLPLLLHPEDGSVITTRVQRDDVWMLHFGKQEQGHALPIDSFIQEAAFSCLDTNVEWSIDMLPSYSDIEQVLRDIPRNKAAGLDNIPGEVLKAAPAAAARLLFPLFVKSMLLQKQPLQWRGGILYEAFKRSGLQSSVQNYRSLFVSSYVAKTYHRVRAQQNASLLSR